MKPFKTPFELAGMSIGMGMMGEALGSEGLKQGGAAAGNFIAPAINISMGGMLINQLKELNKDARKVQEKTQKEK